MRDLYLAAPFFNERELAVVNRICGLCQSRTNICLFSPFHYNQTVQGNIQDPIIRRKVFNDNVRELRDCTEILAWIDRLQPSNEIGVYLCEEKDCQITTPGLNPRLLRPTGEGQISARNLEPIKGPLCQPDLGTVWELGYGYALQKRTALFTLEPPGNLNLMLTEAAVEVIHGWEQLEDYLNRKAHEMPLVGAGWTGGVE